jgi:hypothetical protein
MEGKPTRRTDALAADRAFVVQFRAGPTGEPLAELAGRVEHVHSGAVRHFESLDGLLEFLERAIAPAPAKAKAKAAKASD